MHEYECLCDACLCADAQAEATQTVTEDVLVVERTSSKPCPACGEPLKKGAHYVKKGRDRVHLSCGSKGAA